MRKAIIVLYLAAILLPGGCSLYWTPELYAAEAIQNVGFYFEELGWYGLNILGFAAAGMFAYRLWRVLHEKSTEGERKYAFFAITAILGALVFVAFLAAVTSAL